MEIKKIKGNFSVCKVEDYSHVNLNARYCFTGKTEGENSLICLTEDVPKNTTHREDGWRAFRIEGALDFSLIGVLAEISAVLAEAKIPLLALSTFDTDYFFVKEDDEIKALNRLSEKGYKILTGDPYGDYFKNRKAADTMKEYSEQHDEWK